MVNSLLLHKSTYHNINKCVVLKIENSTETAMGASLYNMKSEEKKYREAVHEMGDMMFYR